MVSFISCIILHIFPVTVGEKGFARQTNKQTENPTTHWNIPLMCLGKGAENDEGVTISGNNVIISCCVLVTVPPFQIWDFLPDQHSFISSTKSSICLWNRRAESLSRGCLCLTALCFASCVALIVTLLFFIAAATSSLVFQCTLKKKMRIRRVFHCHFRWIVWLKNTQITHIHITLQEKNESLFVIQKLSSWDLLKNSSIVEWDFFMRVTIKQWQTQMSRNITKDCTNLYTHFQYVLYNPIF